MRSEWQTERNLPVRTTETRENLQARYKPIGLRAVVAATRCRPEAKGQAPRHERDIPAVLRSHNDWS